MKRTPFVCGNWKMHHGLEDTRKLARTLARNHPPHNIDVVIAPVAPMLHKAVAEAQGTRLKVAAQNVHYADKGAFTGEWTVAQLKDVGVTHVIIGHSERRQYFNETDDTVAKKLRAAIDGGLIPIACVGETLAEREGSKTESVVTRQVHALTDTLSGTELSRVVVAYEPVWAIGTGKTASAAQAQEVHALIRGIFHKTFASEAEKLRIIYGGSVKADNARELMSERDIDGALVGGASLEAVSFLQIVDAALVRVG
jgi:triosephosphate isomerase